MITSRFSTFSAIALLVGVFACYSIAAPRSASANKNDAAIVDEGDKAPEAKSGDTAQKDSPTKQEAAPAPCGLRQGVEEHSLLCQALP